MVVGGGGEEGGGGGLWEMTSNDYPNSGSKSFEIIWGCGEEEGPPHPQMILNGFEARRGGL